MGQKRQDYKGMYIKTDLCSYVVEINSRIEQDLTKEQQINFTELHDFHINNIERSEQFVYKQRS